MTPFPPFPFSRSSTVLVVLVGLGVLPAIYALALPDSWVRRFAVPVERMREDPNVQNPVAFMSSVGNMISSQDAGLILSRGDASDVIAVQMAEFAYYHATYVMYPRKVWPHPEPKIVRHGEDLLKVTAANTESADFWPESVRVLIVSTAMPDGNARIEIRPIVRRP